MVLFGDEEMTQGGVGVNDPATRPEITAQRGVTGVQVINHGIMNIVDAQSPPQRPGPH